MNTRLAKTFRAMIASAGLSGALLFGYLSENNSNLYRESGRELSLSGGASFYEANRQHTFSNRALVYGLSIPAVIFGTLVGLLACASKEEIERGERWSLEVSRRHI